jgi:hypothetical protein
MATKMVTAAQIAQEMSLPPKRVRAILRKLEMSHDGRWRWPVAEKAQVKQAIKDARKRPVKAKAAPKPKGKVAAKRERKQQAVETGATVH